MTDFLLFNYFNIFADNFSIKNTFLYWEDCSSNKMYTLINLWYYYYWLILIHYYYYLFLYFNIFESCLIIFEKSV